MNPITQRFDNLRIYLKTLSLLFFVSAVSVNARAQVKDSTVVKPTKEYKNTVKINLTSYILYHNGFQLNYERVLSNKRSITVWGGPIQFPMPSNIANSSIQLYQDKIKSGYTFGADYRFYLAKENKYAAPRGVYLAPFMSFYHFHNQRLGRDTANQDKLTLNTSMNFFNVGCELGYQFVIKNRFVVDCVLLGPALSSYYFSTKLDGVVTGDYDENIQAVIDALKNKYPLLKDISSGGTVSGSGISNFWSIGFRYAIHIGYRF
jgi:hypothetical protein